MFRFPGLTLAALVAFALTAPTFAAEPAQLKPGEWPQAHSDLKADPNIRFGSLPNGMRYAILKNATPPGQASMRLRFDVGSLMERDDQQGLAHFLEHMAFNGSKNVPGRGKWSKRSSASASRSAPTPTPAPASTTPPTSSTCPRLTTPRSTPG